MKKLSVVGWYEVDCVFYNTTDTMPDMGNIPGIEPPAIPLKFMPFVFDMGTVRAFRQVKEDDDTAPFTMLYFGNNEFMCINVEYEDFFHVWLSFHTV